MTYAICCSLKRVARLMRERGLHGAYRRKGRGITRRDARCPVFPDRVQWAFAADVPNRLWMGDLTQHSTGDGWLYLVTVIDGFSRKVVGCAMGERPTAERVIGALNMAVRTRLPAGGLMHHSDHGAQYTSLAFRRWRHSALGYLSPEEFKGRWRPHHEVAATVA